MIEYASAEAAPAPETIDLEADEGTEVEFLEARVVALETCYGELKKRIKDMELHVPGFWSAKAPATKAFPAS